MTYMDALKKMSLIIITCLTFNLGLATTALAAADTTASEITTQSENENKDLSQNDQTHIGRLAELSGKTKEEILKMRTEQKMGWGAIAKNLGVHPRELGQAIRNERKERNAQRQLEKNERKEQRLAMKEKRRNLDDRKSDPKVK